MNTMRRSWLTFSRVLNDQRSAVRLKVAALASVMVLATAATGFLLMTLGDSAYQSRGKRLFVLYDGPGTQPIVAAEHG